MVLRRSHILYLGTLGNFVRILAISPMVLQARIGCCIIAMGTVVLIHSPHQRKESQPMNTVEQLIDFIKKLTPEQADKIIRQMPRLTALTEEPSQPELHQVS